MPTVLETGLAAVETKLETLLAGTKFTFQRVTRNSKRAPQEDTLPLLRMIDDDVVMPEGGERSGCDFYVQDFTLVAFVHNEDAAAALDEMRALVWPALLADPSLGDTVAKFRPQANFKGPVDQVNEAGSAPYAAEEWAYQFEVFSAEADPSTKA
jgi:hypothetical protein